MYYITIYEYTVYNSLYKISNPVDQWPKNEMPVDVNATPSRADAIFEGEVYGNY